MKPEAFAKVLEDITPEDKLEIDVTQQKNKLALHTILVLYHQSKTAQSNRMWQPVISKESKKESEKHFYEDLLKNPALTAMLLALYKDPKQTLMNFTKALKGKKEKNQTELYDLLTVERSLESHIKTWINSEFVKLKSKAPGVYYSFLYHAALNDGNTEALNEILELFPDKSLLEKLKNLKGKEFRDFYADKHNAKFWETFNLIISHYHHKDKILDLIAEKLLDGTTDLERSKTITHISQTKTPFSKELELHLARKLPKAEELTVRLTVTRRGAQVELPFAEFEVLSPTPEPITPRLK